MPTQTYTPIARQVLGSTQTTVTLSSIPSTYTDLILVASAGLTAGDYPIFQVGNGSVDTGNNYSYTTLVGTGSSALSGRSSGSVYGFLDLAPTTANGEWNSIVHFMNYSNTTTNKTVVARANAGGTGGETRATVSLWRSTAAINTIKIYILTSASFVAGSTFTLYGIKAGS